jgi:BirA family biotin operon repressor/biotin-[acetyl-CoA-carboxylase] ligase
MITMSAFPPSAVSTAASTEQPLPWNVEGLYSLLAPLLPDLSIEVVAEIGSTNTALLERARVANRLTNEGDLAQVRRSSESLAFGRRSADHQPCLLIAEHQTQGRGRQGRAWQSAPGASLTFSIAMPLAPVDWAGFSLAVGVALADALDPARVAAHARSSGWIGIKWPNDLWLMPPDGDTGEGRKFGGLLVETVAAGSSRMVVVGIGLNVLPMVLDRSQSASGFACLQEIDPQANAPAVMAQVAAPLVEALQRFEREGFAAFADRFAARDILLGRAVHAGASDQDNASHFDGVAEGVSGNGALRVRHVDGLREVMAGEVSVRVRAGTDSIG